MLKNSMQEKKRLEASPLGPHLEALARSFKEDGYPDSTVRVKSRWLTEFGRWFRQIGLAITCIDERQVDAFFKHRKQVHRGDRKTLDQFLGHLRKRDVVPDREPVRDLSPMAGILSQYEKHLRSERGLVTHTILQYQSFVRRLLVERFHQGPFFWRGLKPSDISNFVLRHGPTMAAQTAQVMTTAFRSFFRYLFQKGDLQADLAASVPTVAHWRLSTVPKYLTPKEVERVLRACNRRTATGRRDYAILLLLARLGLRSGEVVALQLDDINWRTGEIMVRGKGLVHDWMPLPSDVGKALASYLHRDRPPCKTRQVFVRMWAPHRGLDPHSPLTAIVRCALDRADLHPPCKGARLLRHSLATSMLRSGATMGEIGEVLRHRNPNTTEIYAKVDFDSLRSLAQPWPMGGGK